MKTECRCKQCIECCWQNPGWFGNIEEIENAAKIKKLSVQEFCQEYLIREWWIGENSNIEVPAPRRNFKKENNNILQNSKMLKQAWSNEILQNKKGFVKASWGHNLITGYACIFLNDDEYCAIHKSKPQECRESFCCQESNFAGRSFIAKYWEHHQEFIKQMTPKTPY